MKTLDSLYTEQEVVELSEKVMASLRDKIKEQIANKFYEETQCWLYEIYDNNKSKIFDDLLREITEKYITDPSQSKFHDFRKKLWNEHKGEILPSITDEAIAANMQSVLMTYTASEYYFNWQWKDSIVRLVLSEWDKFKDDIRIKEQFGIEMQRLKDKISNLEDKVEELQYQLDTQP